MPTYQREERELYPSPYATLGTKGRVKNRKGPDAFRTEFQRDIHRILYSQAFRRLRHKTQVFYFPQNDHVSTRLDHVLFVASSARTVARCLGLNEDLAEAIGLAHDLGHAPFGHQGEKILNKIIRDKRYPALKQTFGLFSHEIYGLRVVDSLAKRDREKAGLDLTWEVRDGIISHCGEDFETCQLPPCKGDKCLEKVQTRKKAGYPSTLEGCIVRLIDKVAYCGKDIEDAIAAGILKEKVPPNIVEELGKTNGQIIGTCIEDIIKESHGKDFIAISSKYGDLMHQLIRFNKDHIYESEQAEGYQKQAEQSLKLLFDDLLSQLNSSPRIEDTGSKRIPFAYKTLYEFAEDMKEIYPSSTPKEVIVFDFIAGMTDSFAIRSFQELFVPQATV